MYTIYIHKEEEISLRRRKTHEEYIRELSDKGIQAEPLEYYQGSRTKIKHLWSCGHVTNVLPSQVLLGKGCGICHRINLPSAGAKIAENKRLKAAQELDQRVKEVHGTKVRRDSSTPYVNGYTKMFWLCDQGHSWESIPDNIKRGGGGCPQCANGNTKGETYLRELLEEYGVEFQSQKKFPDLIRVNHLSYDFYIPSMNILIECQGQQHYKPVEFMGGTKRFNIQQERDQLKREYALQNGYYLLEISYKDYRKDRILEILKEAGIIPDLIVA